MRKKIIYLMAAAISLTSCLEVEIVDRVEKEEGFYQTEEHALLAIYGVYRTSYAFAYNKTNWPLVLAGFEDSMYINNHDVSNGTLSSNTSSAVNFWYELYTGINNANELLERIDDIEFTNDNDKSRIKAEAHFLRAIYHYDLYRLYGGANGIPIRTSSTTNIEDSAVPQSPKADVFAQIQSDLDYAAGDNEDGTTRIPLYSSSSYTSGRVTNGAVHAMLAEVFLNMKQYEDAIYEANIVINSKEYSLIDDYADLWDVDLELASRKEHIYSIPFFNDADATTDTSLGSNHAYLYCPPGVQVGGAAYSGNVYGKGAGAHRVQPWFINFYTMDYDDLGYSDGTTVTSRIGYTADKSYMDYRIESTFVNVYQLLDSSTMELGNIVTPYPFNGGNGTTAWGFIGKYIDPNGSANRTNENDAPRIRLADMYLIKAEAYNELGNYAYACEAIDIVRERARKADGVERAYPKYISTDKTDNIGRTLTKDEFRWLVFMERGLEFAGEQKRWFDLTRMTYDGSMLMYDYMMNVYIPSLATTEVINPTTGSADGNNVAGMLEKKKYFPIHTEEVLRNPGVVQNPGY